MSRCVNPDCPWSGVVMSSHWVQVEEVLVEQVGELGQSAGMVKREFAAVACSKRCAAAVLIAAAEASGEPKSWGDGSRI